MSLSRLFSVPFLACLVPLLILSGPPARAVETPLAETMKEKLGEPFDGDLDEILERGVLRVLVPFSKTFYFIDGGQQRGLSVDFMTEFGKDLEKKYRKQIKDGQLVFIPTPRDKLFTDLADGRGDIAAGNLTITPDREILVDFSDPVFDDAREIPVTASDADPIASAEGLSGREVHVRTSSSYHESLLSLNTALSEKGMDPVKIIETDENLEDEDLLELVRSGALQTIIMDEHKAEFWAEIIEGITLHTDAPVRENGQIAYAVRKTAPKLKTELNEFVQKAKKGTMLGNILLRKYLKETKYIEKLDDPKRIERFREILALFQKYGDQYDIDWLLIAAQSYQESQFRQEVKSGAGAVGLMQIKPSTAADKNIGIKGVAQDPDKNVHAGVKYLRFLADRYFEDLKDDPLNQTFFALAAYNAGPSRFERLRKQAAEQGYDPDKWFNNVEWIVMGKVSREPVRYVGNIYKYYVVFDAEKDRQLDAEARAESGKKE
jgi:membrane-bound lytic murein transglycosylase MltF